ncbi:MAG: flagellar biosynthesis protein FlhB [Planctomycetota bacterium]
MADDKDQEKTEQPTGKRLDEARERGQTPLSREIVGALVFLVSIAAIRLGAAEAIGRLIPEFIRFFSLPVNDLMDGDPTALLRMIANICFAATGPIFAVIFVTVVASSVLQIGFRISSKALEPKFDKLNPAQGVKKLFGLDNLVQTLQSLVKLALVGTVCWMTLSGAVARFDALAGRPLTEIILELIDLVFLLCFRVGGGLLVIGLIDLLYRRWKHNKDLMMTKQDVKDEAKQSEGDPKVKGKIREIQRKAAMSRMKRDVEESTVVVRNPTHFAVALKYEDGDAAPRVVAKGRALMALTIIRIAEEAGVEVVINKPLARELYRVVKVGDWIPERLFRAVAELLAIVFKKKDRGPRRSATTGV